MNTRNVLNLARSAKAPVISAGVMMANIAWKIMNAFVRDAAVRRYRSSWTSRADVLQAEVVQPADDAATGPARTPASSR